MSDNYRTDEWIAEIFAGWHDPCPYNGLEEGKDGLVIKGVSEAEEAPGTPTESGGQMPGGVGGGPMEMHSPMKHKTPEDHPHPHKYTPPPPTPVPPTKPLKIYEDGKRRKNYTY